MSKLCRQGISKRDQTVRVSITRDKNFDRMLLLEKTVRRTRRVTWAEPPMTFVRVAPKLLRRNSLDSGSTGKFSTVPNFSIDSELLKRLKSMETDSGDNSAKTTNDGIVVGTANEKQNVALNIDKENGMISHSFLMHQQIILNVTNCCFFFQIRTNNGGR